MIKKIAKILLYLVGLLVLVYAVLWLFSFQKYKVDYGISFSQNYATYLGLDWKKTYSSIFTDLNPKYIRLSAAWGDIEKADGVYDFKDTDYLLSEARKHGTKVLLVIGQKAPRWPECYIPTWTKKLSDAELNKKLLEYVETVVKRYKDDKAVESWQVENEPFIRFAFGDCAGFNYNATPKEIETVRSIDPSRKIVTTDSGEMSLWQKASQAGDVLGVTLYRTVRTPSGTIVIYDWLPPAYYALRAKVWGKDYQNFFIAELQAEPWFRDGELKNAVKDINEETFSPKRFLQNTSYAERTGASRAYLWGVEWWYLAKTKQKDSRYWDTAKEILSK